MLCRLESVCLCLRCGLFRANTAFYCLHKLRTADSVPTGGHKLYSTANPWHGHLSLELVCSQLGAKPQGLQRRARPAKGTSRGLCPAPVLGDNVQSVPSSAPGPHCSTPGSPSSSPPRRRATPQAIPQQSLLINPQHPWTRRSQPANPNTDTTGLPPTQRCWTSPKSQNKKKSHRTQLHRALQSQQRKTKLNILLPNISCIRTSGT